MPSPLYCPWRLTCTRWWLALWLVFPGSALAQQAYLQTTEGPHYAELAIDLQVVADHFAESPEPTISVDTPPGTTLSLIAVHPNTTETQRIVNGQVSRWRRVRFVYRYRLLATRPGTVEVGPFTLRQGAKEASTGKASFNIGAIPMSDAYRFDVAIPSEPIWVGQRVPITIRWWIEESAAGRVVGQRARIPLFDRLDALRFESSPESPARGQRLAVETQSGLIELRGPLTRRTEGNTRYLVATYKRILIGLKPGTFSVDAASIVVDEALKFSRNFFGDRVPSKVRHVVTHDVSKTLTIKPPPEAGRPGSFAGTMGSGYTFDVAADRTVVRTADPIRLTLTVRGDGVLDTVSLPTPQALGLDPERFNLPHAAPTGLVDGEAKRFELTIRIKDQTVSEIPALSLSWFDPEQGRYQTARSRPIALSVRKAETVSAADVVRRPGHQDAVESVGTDPTVPRPPPKSSQHSLAQADLAIITDPSRLHANAGDTSASTRLALALHLFGFAALGAGWLWRRRREGNTEVRRRRSAITKRARALSQAQSPAALADQLRQFSAEIPAAAWNAQRRNELNTLLEQCDNLAYDPNASASGHADSALGQLTERAERLAHACLAAEENAP